MPKLNHMVISERAATVAAIIYPLASIPQALQIFSEKSASGLSLVAWVAFFFIDLVFLAYGISHNLRPIIVSGVMWAVMYTVIITGIIIYG